jgi:amidohydrolase
MRAKLFLPIFLLSSFSIHAQQSTIESSIDKDYPSLESLYKYLHSHPELSYNEANTSRRVAEELQKAGYEITEKVGKFADASRTSYGIVALMKNGTGPTILVRTDLDALPVEEKTGLPYASKVKSKNDAGEEVPVMHACGHDIHMTVFVGTARMLSSIKNQWKGTLVMIGQPSEERGPSGAGAMLNDGLYTRFPKPDYCLAFHDSATLATGKVGYTEGFAMANADSVDITIRGVGGHGANPQTTRDPVVIASEIVVALQTIVSREVPPLESAVVTVGSIHGGTKNNIIPDEVKLQLSVRSYKSEVRELTLKSIDRITKGIAQAFGVPADREPIIDLHPEQFYPATFNNPELVQKMVAVLDTTLGKNNVVQMAPQMIGEDFSRYSLEDHSVPSAMFWLGAVDPKRVEESERTKQPLPSLHSSLFAPVPEPTIKTGVKAMTAMVLDLMNK